MENFLPFTEDVMVVLVHKCQSQIQLGRSHKYKCAERYGLSQRDVRTMD